MTRGRRKKLGFYLLFIAFPLLHYLVFYVYINFNSFILAFKDYYVDDVTKTLTYKNAGFANFVEGWKVLGQNINVIGKFYYPSPAFIFEQPDAVNGGTEPMPLQ